LIGGRGRYHAAAKEQRGNNAKQRGVVNMLAVYGEQIFGRDGEKRRKGDVEKLKKIAYSLVSGFDKLDISCLNRSCEQ